MLMNSDVHMLMYICYVHMYMHEYRRIHTHTHNTETMPTPPQNRYDTQVVYECGWVCASPPQCVSLYVSPLCFMFLCSFYQCVSLQKDSIRAQVRYNDSAILTYIYIITYMYIHICTFCNKLRI